ncbi:MAG TPA: glutamine amidotransferase [Propionibacterium sp.]|nr:glutamine amidotransferase [Propionibacterium sp.]
MKMVVVYQSLLGIYGDQGNSRVLAQRARWRGIDAEVVFAEPGSPLPDDGAIYLLGGGEDAAQTTAVRALKEDGGLFRALDGGAVLLAVCAGYQICGKTFTIGGEAEEEREGLGVLDVTTRRGPSRAVGEILTHWTRPDGSDYVLTGFENHGGHTFLGPDATPLARVEVGVGNNGDGTEGAVSASGRVIGTYPHGPVLARNPALADHLLELALGHPLEPLERATEQHEGLRRERFAFVRR